MDIERINENTVKFYISYVDIEERGFDREEIWYNRERSEELFWEVMDEVHEEEDFAVEGPLWIQVQALEKGLEILVTKAQISKDGQRLELPIPEEKLREFPMDERFEEFLDQHFQIRPLDDDEEDSLEFLLVFHDFEDLIGLAAQPGLDDLQTKLFAYKDKYYVYFEFPEELFTEEDIDNYLSILLEYGKETNLTIHMLEEYGKVVIEKDVFRTLQKYFS
jgi:adapter protein MecA 1/2